MPNLSSNLIELLTYIAPGLVLLYSMRAQFKEVETLISGVNSSNGVAAVIPLLMIALAMGVIVAGVASLFLAGAMRIPVFRKSIPHKVNYAALFAYSADQLQMVRHSGQTDQAYSSMAVALLFSFGFNIVKIFVEHRPEEHGLFLICVNGVFATLMIIASVRYHLRLTQFMVALSVMAPVQNSAAMNSGSALQAP
jgi:hypothetical protein